MTAEGSGAEYLRRLKEGERGAPTQPTQAPSLGNASPQNAAPAERPIRERRVCARYKCEGSVQFRQDGSDVHTWGTFTDISVNGCYIEMTATFPVGTIAHLRLELGGVRVQTKGEVRVVYPFLGMGIAFREMSPDDRLRLAEMVQSVARAAQARPKDGASQSAAEKPPAPDPRRALEALVEFFDGRDLLTREEFYRVLRNSQPASANAAPDAQG